MKPILFEENATEFVTNGIGRLSDAISCIATEERNGQYELELEYPMKGVRFSDIRNRRIIAAIPYDGGKIQGFRIYKISKPINGKVTVNARHISYDLSKNTVMPFSEAASSAACANALSKLKANAVETCPFTFWTDVTTAASYTQTAPGSIRSRLGGVEGSILDRFGGEYEWDNWSVKLHRRRGRTDTGIILRYGKNITDLTQEENISDTVTGIVPYWSNMDGTELVTLPEKAVYSQYAGNYTQKMTVPMDFSEDYQDAPTVEHLRTAAQVAVNSKGFGLPEVSIEVSFTALWQTEEYKDIAPLERVQLCDEISVYFERLGVEAKAKVVKTAYDVLAERYKSIQIGSVRASFAQTINEQNASTAHEVAAQAIKAGAAITNATKWLTSAGGYVIAIKNDDGSWRELIFASSTDMEAKSTRILRINNNGIGFSTTGIDGPYRNAWTIDGNLVADFIHGGTLTLGGNNNVNGWLRILNAAGEMIGKWDADGIVASNGSFTGTINATSGSLSAVTVNSLSMGGTTWSGTELNDRLNYILSVANTANAAAQKAQSAADDVSDLAENVDKNFRTFAKAQEETNNYIKQQFDWVAECLVVLHDNCGYPTMPQRPASPWS